MGERPDYADMDYDQDEFDPDSELDLEDECGRWNDGGLSRQCRLAGSEWCDWQCPIGLTGRR